MATDVVINDAKVKDTERAQAQEILNGYEPNRIRLVLNEQGNLGLAESNGENYDDDWPQRWPKALPLDRVPNRDEFDDDDQWDSAKSEAFAEYGDEGFLDLLRKLSPLLETPLIILALELSEGDTCSQVWVVQPGADVQVLGASLD